MTYLTMDWWQGKCSRETLERYWAYLAGVRHRRPVEMLPLLDDVSLHDARLLRLDLDVARRGLTIDLAGHKYTPEQGVAVCPRTISLAYGGVRSFSSTADPEACLPGPHGYGDLGYDEVEVLNDGGFEHRLLFSTGIELAVRFEQFRLKYDDLPAPGG